MARDTYPTMTQLALPLLSLIGEGLKSPAKVYDRLAEEFDLSPLLRDKLVPTYDTPAWWRRVRWVFQQLKAQGLITRSGFNLWDLTEDGRRHLQNAKPGVVITVYATEQGKSVWAECEHALSYVKDGSVKLLFTSTPYPLARPKEYGNLAAAEHVDWLVDVLRRVQPCMAADGSVVLNMGNVYEHGSPTMSLYQERLMVRLADELGLHVCEKMYWYNTGALPTPTEYTNKERCRVRSAIEPVYWLAWNPRPHADNLQVLREYSQSQKRLMAKGIEAAPEYVRPSGHQVGRTFAKDNGGSIPDNVIVLGNTASNDAYLRGCRAHGLKPHPARCPVGLPAFFIKFLTNPGDMVMDIFAGSNTTGQAAEELGRRWLAIEKSFHYIKGQLFRFPSVSVNPMFLLGAGGAVRCPA